MAAVKRFSKAEDQPSEAEEALLFWVNQSLHALRFRIISIATVHSNLTFQDTFGR